MKTINKINWVRKAQLLIMIVLLASSLGCTKLGPDYTPPKVNIPDKWETSLDNKDGIEVDQKWWTQFEDRLLNKLIEVADHQNLNVRQGIYRIQEARALMGFTNSNKYPNFKFTTNASSVSQSEHTSLEVLDNDELYNAGFDANWELDLWGKLLRQRESAAASHSQMVANYGDMLLSIRAEVARVYIEIRTVQTRINLLNESIGLQEKSLNIAEAWFKNGGRTELDFQQTKALVFETRSQLPALEQELFQLKTALALLLGSNYKHINELTRVHSSIPQLTAVLPNIGMPVTLLRRRPDIVAAEYVVKARTAQLGIIEAEYYPSLSLTGSFGVSVVTGVPTIASGSSGSSSGDLLSNNAIQHNVGAGISWNIFNFERIDNRLLAADAVLRQSIEAYKSTVLSAVKETSDVMNNIQQSKKQSQLLSESVSAYYKANTLSLSQYKDGATDFQAVLDSMRRLVTVQQTEANVLGKQAKNFVALYKTIGGGWNLDANNHLAKATQNKNVNPSKALKNKIKNIEIIGDNNANY